MGVGDVRLAFVGFGSSAEFFHLSSIKCVPSLQVVAAFDPSNERQGAAKRLGIPNVSDLNDLPRKLSDLNVKLVTVASPNACHFEQALVAMKIGADVVIEKPVCLDYEQYTLLENTAQSQGTRFCAFHNRQFDNDHIGMLSILKAGVLGTVLRIDLNATRIGHWTDYAVPDFDPAWRKSARWGGGVWNDWGPHALDQLLRLADFEPPTEVSAWSVNAEGEKVESMVAAQFVWPGKMGRILISANEAASNERCRLVGTLGYASCVGSDQSGQIEVCAQGRSTVIPYKNDPSQGAPIYEDAAKFALSPAGRKNKEQRITEDWVYRLLGQCRESFTSRRS